MARLPQPGGDKGNWGDILNDYLSQAHDSGGNLNANTVGTSQLQDQSISETKLTPAVQTKLNDAPTVADDSISTAKLQDDSVTTAKLADDAVTSDKIAPGAVTKSDVGLGNVDNTTDLNKPISTATQTALNAKYDTSTATTALAGKQDISSLATDVAAHVNDSSILDTTIATKITTAIDGVTSNDIIATAAAGALTRGKWTRVDATAGTTAMTLANATAARQVTIVEKSDATANTVTIALNLRGAGATLTLTSQYETLVLVADDDLNWYVHSGHRTAAALDAATDARISTALTTYVPGTELLYAERLTAFGTTATAIGVAANITGLSGNVVGKGRPVEIDVFLSGVYHSVADTSVLCYLAVDGLVLTTSGLLVASISPKTNGGPVVKFSKRLILNNAQSYSLQVGIYGSAAGTSTLTGATYQANYIAVTSR